MKKISGREIQSFEESPQAALEVVAPRDVAPRDAGRGLWRALPGFLALGVATGAGCYVLAHWVTIAELTFNLYASLAVGLVLSFGAQAGAGDATGLARWARGCEWARRVILAGAVVLLVLHSEFFAPLEARTEVNQILALMVGWFMVALVYAIGLSVHERPLSVGVPLIPGLSLFGLLNIQLVDTVVEIGFLIYVASALFLLAYERRPHSTVPGETARPESGLEWARMRKLVGHYGLACGAWFGFFVCGAALIFYPLQAVLPAIAPPFANRLHEAGPPALLNWAGASDVVELRGGRIELSDRVVLRVWRAPNAQAQGLWRGRVYHRYDGSRWRGVDKAVNQKRFLSPSLQSEPPRIELPPPPAPDPALARLTKTFSQVELVEPPAPMIFAPGKPVTIYNTINRVRWERNGTAQLLSSRRNSEGYGVMAREARLRPAAFSTVRGLTGAQLNDWKADAWRRETLQLPDDAEDARALQAIARQIEKSSRAQGQPFNTPAQKATAIARYLSDTCVYSLDAPVVPSTQDSVLFFLTQSKAGACDLFASSMAMLLRTFDVPARLATGYLEPEAQSAAGNLKSTVTVPPGEDSAAWQRFEIQEKQAHAWVEYYVPRVGWLSYDPTATTRTNEPPPPPTLGEILDWPQLRSQWKVLLLPVAGILLIGCGLAWSVMDWRKQHRTPQLRPTPEELARQATVARIARAYARAARLLRRKVPHHAHLTPQEYEAIVSRASLSVAVKQEFSALTHLLIQARYGLIPPQADANLLRLSLERLRQALK